MSLQGGRPATPTQWATLTNFPGSPTSLQPWLGQPLKLNPLVPYQTPGGDLPAEEFNFMFWQTSTDVANLSQQAGTPDGLCWRSGFQTWASSLSGGTVTSYVLATPPVWFSSLGVWIAQGLGTQASVNEPVSAFASADGYTWTYVGDTASGAGVNSVPGGFFGRTADAVVCSVNEQDSIWFAALNNYQAGGSVHSTILSGSNVPALGSNCWISGTYFNSQYVFWCGGSSTNAPMFAATDTTNFAAASSWSPPTSFTINNLAHIVSPAAILLFPSGSSVVSAYMRTTDGHNWAQQAMPTLNAGEAVVDATYDSVGGYYYFLSSTSSACRLWQSSTGLAGSWTVVSTVSHPGYAVKANGTEMLIWIQWVVGSTTFYRALITTTASSLSGVTWYFTSLQDTSAPTGLFALKCNGSQFVYVNNGRFVSSLLSGGGLSQQTL